MIKYTEHNYGCDIDGNRGMKMEFYDLEPSDNDEIVEKLKQYGEENGYESIEDYPEVVTITMICPIDDEDIDFDITVRDFL